MAADNRSALTNVCPVCDTPDGDHLDWCTPQARAKAAFTSNVRTLMQMAAVMVRDTGACRVEGFNRREIYEQLIAAAGDPYSPPETKAPQWIRSSERLPEIGQRVLGHVAIKPYVSFDESCDGEPDCFVRVGDDRWANRNSNNFLGQHATVVWWMPCPDDPVDSPVKSSARHCSECDDTGTVVDTEGREYDCYACSKGLPDRILKEPQ